MITIRPWDDDAAAVAALVAAIWADDPLPELFTGTHGPDREAAAGWRRSRCAVEADGAVAGVGTLWQNGLHPAAWNVNIHVAAPWRRQGIGTRLLEALTELAPRPKPLRSSTREADVSGRGFLAAHGFAPLMRTRRGRFAPEDIPVDLTRELAAAEARVLAAGYQLMTLPEATRHGSSRAAVARLHVELYGEAHAWSRPRPVSEAEAEAIFLAADDLLPEAMHLVLAGPTPVAVASLRPSARAGEVGLGWAGAMAGAGAAAADLAAAALGRCFDQASAARWRLEFEADEGDAWWWYLMNQVPAQLEDDWLTFRTG